MDACLQPHALGYPGYLGLPCVAAWPDKINVQLLLPVTPTMSGILSSQSSILLGTALSLDAIGGDMLFLSGQQERITMHHNFLWEEDWVPILSQVEPRPVLCLSHQLISESSDKDLAEQIGQSQHILYLGALEQSTSAEDTLHDVLRLLQGKSIPKLTVVTNNAMAVCSFSAESCSNWHQALLWGLLGSVRNEYAQLSLECLDVSDTHAEQMLSNNGFFDCPITSEVDYVTRQGNWYSRRLVKSKVQLSFDTRAQQFCTASSVVEQASINMQRIVSGSTVDLERYDSAYAASEALARQFLTDAMLEILSVEDVEHWHHRKLWYCCCIWHCVVCCATLACCLIFAGSGFM